jgi:amino acid transporter
MQQVKVPDDPAGADPEIAREVALDARDLRHFGYAQELFRTMGGFSNFAIAFSIISIITGIATQFDYGLEKGGPAEMSIGWPLVAFFTLAVAASMAELASAFPTSGGTYHWAKRLGGPGCGWFTAWIAIIGLIANVTAVDYGCAQFVVPLLGLSSTPRILLLVYALILVSHGLLNHYGIRLVAWLNDFSVTVHIIAVVAIGGALVFFSPRQPASFFFARVSSTHGSYFWAFLLGLLMAQWTLVGYDGSAHVSEETVDPRHRVPWAIVNSVVISAIVGYLLLFALTLSIRSIPAALGATDIAGNKTPAMIAVLVQALGERAGTIMSWTAVIAMWFCGVACITSNSRAIYAFARDGGMPGSRLWRTVNEKHSTPGPAIWLSVFLSFLIAISSGAYSVVTSMSTVALYVSYAIPIYLGWRARRNGGWEERGPWNLGRFSEAINLIALAWTGFICVILVMPPNGVAGEALAGMIAILAIGYFLDRRRLPERA